MPVTLGGSIVSRDLDKALDIRTTPSDQDDAATYQCGRGDLNFRLTKITTTLITRVSRTAGLTGNLPIVPTGSYTRNNDQTLVFNQLVLPPYYQDPALYADKERNSTAARNEPIAAVLDSLRRGMVDASKLAPSDKNPAACLTSSPPNSADMAGTFEIAITVKKEGSLKAQVIIGPTTYGPSVGGAITNSSTIKATFEPYYADSPVLALDKPVDNCPDSERNAITRCMKDTQYAWCTGCGDLVEPDVVKDKAKVLPEPTR